MEVFKLFVLSLELILNEFCLCIHMLDISCLIFVDIGTFLFGAESRVLGV